MKRLDELKISPTPWKKAVNNFGMGENMIWDSGNRRVVYNGIDNRFLCENMEANLNIMIAVPELYEALYDVIAYCEATHLVPSGRFKKVLDRAKSAIAKAAGEKETK